MSRIFVRMMISYVLVDNVYPNVGNAIKKQTVRISPMNMTALILKFCQLLLKVNDAIKYFKNLFA